MLYFTLQFHRYICAKLLLNKFIHTAFPKCYYIYPGSTCRLYCSYYTIHQSCIYLLYCCPNQRFTFGVIKQTLRSQTNNIFTVNTKLNCAIHPLYSILHRMFWRQGCNQTLLIDMGTSPLKLLIR